MAPQPDELKRLTSELVAQVNAAYGLYLDATMGFAANLTMIEKTQVQTGATDENAFFYAVGAPTDPAHVLVHQTTQGALKGRNREDGPNYVLLSRFLIVLLYELWEAGYRSAIAAAAGVPRETLLFSVFGGLRLLRHEILHNQSRLSDVTIRKLEVVTAPTAGSVDLDRAGVETLVRHVKAALDELVQTFTGEDPGYRAVWRVS